MKDMNESFDDQLSRRLRGYSEDPRKELWQNIMAITSANVKPPATKRNSRTAWMFILVLLTIGGRYYYERISTSAKEPVASRESSPLPPVKGIDKAAAENERPAETAGTRTGTRNSVGSSKQNTTDPNTSGRNDISKKQAGFDQTASMHVIGEENSDLSTTDDNVIESSPSSGIEPQVVKYSENEKSVTVESKTTKPGAPDEVKTVIKEKEKKHNKFSVYFIIMPTFGYQRINSNSSDDVIVESIDRISTFSTDRLGVRAELGVEDPITNRIKVFGGLVYFQRKQTIDYTEKQVEYTEVSQGPNGEIIVVPEFKHVQKSFEYELKNLGVQVGVSYELSRKKLLQTLGTGFEFHVALNKLEDKYKAEFTNNPSAYVFYNLYYRLQYPAEGRLKAVFQPTLNYSFYINQNVNAPFYVKPYGLGLNIGCTYNF